MICVSIGKTDFEKALSICNTEELVEIRADLMDLQDAQYLQLFNAVAKVVFTCRKSNYNKENRIILYKQALGSEVAYIDLDMQEDGDIFEALKEDIIKSKSKLILSYHNFEKTPDRSKLKEILKEMDERGANIAKIACRVINDKDLVNLLSLYRIPGTKLVLGMGGKGMLTRVAAVYMGAEFTFAFPEGGKKTAPGQLTKKELEEIFEIMKP